jgi:hypothetical protein
MLYFIFDGDTLGAFLLAHDQVLVSFGSMGVAFLDPPEHRRQKKQDETSKT